MIETSDERVAYLLRVLRKYADSRLGPQLSDAFAEIGKGEEAGLVAFEEGSDERIIESVCAGVHGILAALVTDLYVELGTARLEARRALEDIDPDDFGRGRP